MKFDKSRVYTALNADELKIGSKCIFANCLADLMDAVENDKKNQVGRFTKAFNCDYIARFCDNYGGNFVLAYLVESSAEPKYKPFKNIEEAMKAIKAHGGWIKYKVSGRSSLVFAYDEETITISDDELDTNTLFLTYVFADDGSPCGKLEV
ncbi:hypothetical protein [Treponema lecithinolyticum]